MDITVRQIRSFVAVAKAGSYTRAAATLRMAQPTLTVQVRRLEDALRVRLLDRTSRSVALTRVGRDLLPVLERTVQDLDTVLDGVREFAAETRGIVRVAALPSFAAGPFPDVLRTFRESYPGASFQVQDVIAGRGIALVRAEEVDIGVLGGEIASPDIETLACASERMVVVYPKGHPIAKAHTVTAEILASFPLVLMHPDTSVRAVVDAAFRGTGLIVDVAVEATYMMTAVSMVRAGLGLAILPDTSREIRAEPGLLSRPIEEPSFVRSIVLVKKAGRTLPPLSAAFAQHLASALTGRGRRDKAR